MTPDDIIQAIKHLTTSNITPEKIGEFYEIIRPSMNGLFSDAHHQEVLRLISGAANKEKNIAQEVYEWVMLQDGVMNVTDCYSQLQYTTKQEKTAARVAFHRLIDKYIEKVGDKSGTYRRIQDDVSEQKWWEAKGTPLKLEWPLGITQPKIYPGNIVLVEGSKSQGKTRFALDFARLNRKIFKDKKIIYQNVEMADDEINDRVTAYENDGMWKKEDFRKQVVVKRVTQGWWDFVGKEDINIIDYLLEYTEPYKIAHYIFKIHEKLTSGIALICVQKDPNKLYGTGGYAIRNIPRLIISLQNHIIKLEDVKSFWIHSSDDHNPTGLMRRYKMPGLWKMIPDGEWTRELDATKDKTDNKYKDFDGFEHEE